MKFYSIYIIECENGHYYTGYTTDLTRRYNEHLAGSLKCKYTKANKPKKLAANWTLAVTLSDILRIEHAIKKLTKTAKIELIKNNSLTKILEKLNIIT